MRVLKDDASLQSAIRHQLTAHRRAEAPKGPTVTSAIAGLERKRRKLLDLHYADQIDGDTFAEEHRLLTTKIKTLQQQEADFEREQKIREEAVDKFDVVAELLAHMDLERIWKAATLAEQRTLVEDLVDSVCIFPDQITVQVAGAPPFMVALDEIGLTQGCKPVVSEGRRPQSTTGGWNGGAVECRRPAASVSPIRRYRVWRLIPNSRAIPSRRRSRMRVCSNSATAPMTDNMRVMLLCLSSRYLIS